MSVPAYQMTFSEVWNSRYHLALAQLSSHWKPAFRPKEYKVVLLPLIYLGGMCVYALSLVVRVMAVVIDFIQCLVAIAFIPIVALSGYYHEEDGNNARVRLRILALSILQLGGGIVGTIAPPLGYAIDEWLHQDKDFDQDSISAIYMNQNTKDAWCSNCTFRMVGPPPPQEEKKG